MAKVKIRRDANRRKCKSAPPDDFGGALY